MCEFLSHWYSQPTQKQFLLKSMYKMLQCHRKTSIILVVLLNGKVESDWNVPTPVPQ